MNHNWYAFHLDRIRKEEKESLHKRASFLWGKENSLPYGHHYDDDNDTDDTDNNRS